MSNSTLGLSGPLLTYFQAHAYREAPILAELRAETAKLGGEAAMQIAPEQGAFMGMLVSLLNAKNILEIGTFTGYSALAMALACEARITAVDVSREWTDIARRFWQRAGVADRISLSLAGGEAAIAGLLSQHNGGTFDACFIDADKTSYDTYYEGALMLLRVGGLMMIDNVLWSGDVADPQKTDADTAALRALNEKILNDPRLTFCIVPIADGVTLLRKL